MGRYLRVLALLQARELDQTMLKELKQVNFPDNLGLRLPAN